jgi:hypothetical protein
MTDTADTAGMHPFVALMRKYCIDYTNSHDQSLYDEIMEPDYVVHISGFDLPREPVYRQAVTDIFQRAPGLGLVVHEFVLNGDRLCMRFSEHGSMPAGDDGQRRLACWRGIGLYKWNGTRLTENYVEQDYLSTHRQLTSGVPHELDPIHLDPWVATEAVFPNEEAEETVRTWLAKGDLINARRHRIDDSVTDGPVLDFTEVSVTDLFSAGTRVPFHITARGPYRGGVDDVPNDCIGQDATLNVAGIAEIDRSGTGDIAEVYAVTTRMTVRSQFTGLSPV